MIINMYELRDDERPAFDRVCAELPGEVTVRGITEHLSAANLDGLDGAEGVVIVNKSPLDADLLARLRDRGVRYVATRSIGFNHIDVEAAHALGIRVCNTTYPPYGVAEFAVMLMLIALRSISPRCGGSRSTTTPWRACRAVSSVVSPSA